MSTKQRLSASVDVEVLVAAQSAVSAGRAINVSTWVNEALHRMAEHDRRMHALDEFLAAYEAEHGVISEHEIRDASRSARARAIAVRGKSSGTAPRGGKATRRPKGRR